VTITIADVLKKIDDDLAWRGIEDYDRKLGHVVLEREQAQYLRDWAITLIKERDALLFESEQRHALVTEKEK
jgi:hypothetical protein